MRSLTAEMHVGLCTTKSCRKLPVDNVRDTCIEVVFQGEILHTSDGPAKFMRNKEDCLRRVEAVDEEFSELGRA